MKFQKSFFWSISDVSLVSEFINFFTKEFTEVGRPSRSLVRSDRAVELSNTDDARVVDIGRSWRLGEDSRVGIIDPNGEPTNGMYDFVMIDLREALQSCSSLADFLENEASSFFGEISTLLAPDKYCAMLVPAYESRSTPFPIAWSFALAGRQHMRLRDEKVGLSKQESEPLFYCIIFQNNPDDRSSLPIKPGRLSMTTCHEPYRDWTIPKPPPRNKNELLHPAKYPETLVQEFIEAFTLPGDTVFDPMAGTGSTVVAALRSGRNGIGIELSEKWAEVARSRIEQEFQPTLFDADHAPRAWKIICNDAMKIGTIDEIQKGGIDYLITSPPYWSMLNNPGSENQRARRNKDLSLVYSGDEEDLGNVTDYDKFIDMLAAIYNGSVELLKPGAAVTIIVKNVKRNHVVYPLAWDLTRLLAGPDGRFQYLGNTLWCQDDIGLKPFGVGAVWVSNILHQYCLHFRLR